MKQHVSVLGVLHIVFGVMGLVAAATLLLIFGGAAGILGLVAQEEPDARIAVPIVGAVGIGLFMLIAVLSVPGIVVGLGLLKLKPWARILGIVLSALNLMNVPIGTLLGAYGLWVVFQAETEALFRGSR